MADADLEAFLASLSRLRDLAMFLLMLDGGLRPGEVLSLQVDDISYGRRRVTSVSVTTILAARGASPGPNEWWTCTSHAHWTR